MKNFFDPLQKKKQVSSGFLSKWTKKLLFKSWMYQKQNWIFLKTLKNLPSADVATYKYFRFQKKILE